MAERRTAFFTELRRVCAEGDLDFRGTLGVDRDASVGFASVRLYFDLDTDAPPEQIEKLVELTERYCVVYQTLKNSPVLELHWHGMTDEDTESRQRATQAAAPHAL